MGVYNPVTRESDGKTVRLDKEEAEHADTTAKASRVILVDEAGVNIGTTSNAIDVNTSSSSITAEYGTVSALAQTSTDTIVSYTAISGDKLRGFVTSGNREGFMELQLNSTTILAGRTEVGNPSITVFLPLAISLNTNDTLDLKVTNNGQGSADFEGTIIVEN